MSEKQIKFFENDKFATRSGAKLTEVRPGYAKAELVMEEHHKNAVGFMQGGAIFTLADYALAGASNSYGYPALSVTNTINFIKAVKSGKLTAVATEIAFGSKIGTFAVEVTDESGAKIAFMTATVYKKNEAIPELMPD